jgi:DNA repair exonuclease SbcCD nuclease subunit
MYKKLIASLMIIIATLVLLFPNTNFAVVKGGKFTELNNEYLDQMKPSDTKYIKNNEKIELIYPLSTVPALVEKNTSFEIIFKAPDFEDVYAFISTAYEPVINEVWLNIENISMQDDVWKIRASVPLPTYEELYNLSIIVTIDGNYYEKSCPRSVAIFDEFSDTFSFVHLTDLHIGDPRGFLESISQTIGYKSIKRCINEINLLHPDFVIISGDLVYGQLYPFEYSVEYEICYEMIQKFDVPTFLCPGNHDGYYKFKEDGLSFWKNYFGPLNYSFDYGDYHFLSINSFDMPAFFRLTISFIPMNWGGSISQKQLSWIKQDLEESNHDLKFIFLHHNPIWETTKDSLIAKPYENREKLLSLINDNDVDMVLAGHVHYDSVNIVNDTIFITTTTPQSSVRNQDGYWGYRLVEIENGTIISYNYKEPKYSIPSYKLSHKILSSQSIASAEINNQLDKVMEVLLKFVMPKANYIAENGSIVMQRYDDTNVEIYVLTEVAGNGVKTVTINKVF